jgi:hypothetical protein
LTRQMPSRISRDNRATPVPAGFTRGASRFLTL